MRVRLLTVAAVLSLLAGAAAASAAGVSRARGATHAAVVRAFVAQDGTSAGIGGVYVSGAHAVVCQRTPDAGLMRFLFTHPGRRWHFAFSTHGTHTGTATQRRLERACH